MPIPRNSSRTRDQAASQVYSVHMRIACIEMEKSRRQVERRAAQQRIALIDQRLAQLEREKAALVAALDRPPVAAATVGNPVPPATDAGGMPIKY